MVWNITQISICSGHSGSALRPVSEIIVCAALHRDADGNMFLDEDFKGVLFCFRMEPSSIPLCFRFLNTGAVVCFLAINMAV